MDVDRFKATSLNGRLPSSEDAPLTPDSPASTSEIRKHHKLALPPPSLILNQNRSRRGSNTLSEKANNQTKEVRESARRMIADGLMPLETVSRLTRMSMTMVHELAAEVAWKSKQR